MLLKEIKKINIEQIIKYFFIAELFIFLSSGILTSVFPRLSFYKYFSDILFVIFIPFYILKKGYKKRNNISSKKLYIFIIFSLFVFVSGVSFFWSNYNLLSTILEFRFYIIALVMFYLYSFHLDISILSFFLHKVHYIQIINLVLVLYQYLVMKLHPDFCNGIFGFIEYNNAIQGIFCTGLSIIAIVYFISNKWDLKKSFGLLLLNCSICAFSEIKAYFILLIVIFLISIFIGIYLKRLNKKFITMILWGGAVFIVGIILLSIIMPENLKFMFNVPNYINYEVYGAGDGAGRLNIYNYINDNIFKNSLLRLFFGMGIGNVSNQFVYTSGKVFSNTGLLGTVLLFSMFISIFYQLFINRNQLNANELTSIVFSIILLISIFLWNCIFTSSSYFIFLLLSLINLEEIN